MVVYLVRHYVFAAVSLIFGRGSGGCLDGGGVFEPFVSVVVPAHDEELVIGRLLERVCNFVYPRGKLQVLVVDDGSCDGTARVVEGFAAKYGFVELLRREVASGKAGALNEALRHVRGEIVYFFDADYVPEADFIGVANRGFLDLRVGAVQGYIGVLNLRSWVSRVVALERIGGYRVDQWARDVLGLVPQIGGTACGVRRSLLEALGGFDENVLAEDTDLTFRVVLAGYRVRYLPEAFSLEEAVEDVWRYYRQRSRWAKGHMQCAFKHFLPLMRTKNLSFREKLDALLLLNIYFVPVLVGFGWVLGGLCFLLGYGLGAGTTAFVLTLVYLVCGNIAPLSEVIVGVALEGRWRLCRYIPLLFLAFFLNVIICTIALVKVVFWELRGKPRLKWDKTVHKGAC